jgi:hypothetical protein
MAAYSTWVTMIPMWPWAPPHTMDGTEMAFEFSRRVVAWMSSKVGLFYILGRTGLGKTLIIYSTISALLGAMLVLLCVCEGCGLLDGDNAKEINLD